MSTEFDYLLDRIYAADFEYEPFPHLYLRDFLDHQDFAEVSKCQDVYLAPARNIDHLFSLLAAAGYEAIDFPGCTRSKSAYIRELKNSSRMRRTHPACEGQGMALRLQEPKSERVRALTDFFASEVLHELLRKKFGIDRRTTFDGGLHKYLQAYEISPHPDIRSKALTWMLNLNPANNSEHLNIHTHYLKFKPERSFITELWKHNPTLETCWVPWDWCTTVKRQTENNSMVIFSPRWDTMHAVKTDYDHLATQRTQMYGNLWYETMEPPLLKHAAEFKDLDFLASFQRRQSRTVRSLMAPARSTAERYYNKLIGR
jgi:hypothetical protein